MGLFDMPSRQTKESDKNIAKKTTQRKISKTTIKGGNTILAKISTITALVEKHLGKYKDKYQLIEDAETLHNLISKSIENKIIAIDTETDGLDPILNNIAGLCLYTPGEKPAYVPINHISYITGQKLDNQVSVEVCAKELQRIADNEVFIVMFNAKFDTRVIRNQLGVYLTCNWDCYLAARLMNENEPVNKLKPLHNKYCLQGKEDAFTFDELFDGIEFTKIPPKVGYLYAAHDGIITYEFYEFQKPYLTEGNEKCIRCELEGPAWVFRNIEMPCVNVVADMEDNGVDFDMEYAKALSEKYHKILDERVSNCYSILKRYQSQIDAYKLKNVNHKLSDPFNINSPTQLAILLYDILNVGVIDKKSPRGTGVDILNKIDNDICKAILEYRETEKLISTYIDKLPECVNPKTGHIHCSFNQYGADTGRFSSSGPNLQNIPSHNKDIRQMFKAQDGYVLMSSDYSQQEPKVMTQMCGDKKMLEAYMQGKDLYAEIASVSFNKPYEDCLEFRPDGSTNKEGKERRSQAKSILLGILYGRGIDSIAEQLNTSKEKAQQIKDKVFKGFPAIPKFENDSLDMAYERGYVSTLWGRKRRLPILQKPEFEFEWLDGVAKSENPLDFEQEASTEVPLNIQNKYTTQLKNCRFGQKRNIIEKAREEGIKIIDNGGKQADAQRQCVNSRIQGSAADLTKLAMILVGNDKRLKELDFRLLIAVHDELIAECPKEHIKECSKRFADLMSEAAKSGLTIPISCDVEITENWYGKAYEIC